MKKSEYEKLLKLFLCDLANNAKKEASSQFFQEKAIFIRKELQEGENNFTANVGRMGGQVEKSYGIRKLEVCSEKLSADS